MTAELSIETRTLHAELMERLSIREAQRNIANLDGSFSTKTISGREYLYFQHYSAGNVKRSFCLGAKTPALEELAAQFRNEKRENCESDSNFDPQSALKGDPPKSLTV